jgi:hypothetical protein
MRFDSWNCELLDAAQLIYCRNQAGLLKKSMPSGGANQFSGGRCMR